MDPDLMLEPDDDDDFSDSDLDDLNDSLSDMSDDINNESDQDEELDDGDGEKSVTDERTGKRIKFKDYLAKLIDPLKRAKAKYIRAKAHSIKYNDKTNRIKVKSAAKKVGALTAAGLLLKMMIDHHQDKITKDNEDTLEKIYKQAKAKKANGKQQSGMLMALGGLSPNDLKNTVSQVKNNFSNAMNSSINDVNSNASSVIDKMANMFGINIGKFSSAFSSLIHSF